MPKVVVFGKAKRRTAKIGYFVRAFRERGNETLWLNPARLRRLKGKNSDSYILGRLESFNPDIIFINSQDIPLSVLKSIQGSSSKTVMFFEDPWREDVFGQVCERGRLVDVFIVSASGLHDRYRAAGIKNPVYMINPCDKYEHRRVRPILPIWKSDVAFIGAARENEPRVGLVQKIDTICKVRMYGRYWEQFNMNATLKAVYPRGYRLVCGGAKIVLGADNTSAIEGYWSDRLPFTLGCGGFHLTNYAPGMEKIYTNREHLVWYHDEEECVSLVREYLAKPGERERIAEQGYRYMHEHHTFHHFVDRVIALCETSYPQT
ncbi:MAG TPA: glycosyltransferase [Deltaproteobacteria bacterium]|nr:glycosyltransferase [Deltaproteobacteria bacterium]